MDKIVLPVGNKPLPGANNTPDLTDLVIGTDTFKVNKDGNAVDDKGTVLKTKAELEALKTAGNQTGKTAEQLEAERKLAEKTATIEAQLVEGTELEIDGVKHTLTKEGTIVDKDGKVLKTKDELKALLLANEDAASADTNYIEEIQKATNLTIVGKNGQPNTYENTLPGIIQYAQDVHMEGRKIGAAEVQRELFTKFPVLEAVLDHLTANNGSLNGFTEDVDYSKVSVTDDESQQIDIYTKAQLKRGIPQNEINDAINYLKTDKKLKSYAESGLTYLKAEQTKAATDRANKAKLAKEAEDAEETAYWNDISTAITKKELLVGDKKFKLPEIIKIKDAEGKIVNKTLNDFVEYIEKPLNFKIDNQIITMTQLEYDTLVENTNRTPHHDIFDAYRRFTKYDDSQLIAANVNSQTTKNVIKLVTKADGGGSGTAGKGGKIVLPVK